MANDQTISNPKTIASAPTPSDFKAAYEYLRPRLVTMADAELDQFALDGGLVVQTLLGVCQEIDRHKEAILYECTRLDPNIFDELRQSVFALGHAESLKRGAAGLPSELEDPVADARATRAKMKADLEPRFIGCGCSGAEPR